MSTWQSNPQTPSTSNHSAIASLAKQGTCVAPKAATTRPALQLRRIVDDHRTLEEDRRYHLEAHRAFCKLHDRIDDAKFIEATRGTGHFGSQEVRELRGLLFRVQIADVEKNLVRISKDDDAFMVWTDADFNREYLEAAIAEYLDATLSKKWTIDDEVSCARRSR